MSFSEKTRSVPSRPMGLLPRVALREEPDDRRERQRSEDDRAPGTGRRQRADVVDAHADGRYGDQKEKEERNEEGCHRTIGQLGVSSRKKDRENPAGPVLPPSSPADLVRLRDLSLDPRRVFSEVEPNAVGTVENRLTRSLAEGAEGLAATVTFSGEGAAFFEGSRPQQSHTEKNPGTEGQGRNQKVRDPDRSRMAGQPAAFCLRVPFFDLPLGSRDGIGRRDDSGESGTVRPTLDTSLRDLASLGHRGRLAVEVVRLPASDRQVVIDLRCARRAGSRRLVVPNGGREIPFLEANIPSVQVRAIVARLGGDRAVVGDQRTLRIAGPLGVHAEKEPDVRVLGENGRRLPQPVLRAPVLAPFLEVDRGHV